MEYGAAQEVATWSTRTVTLAARSPSSQRPAAKWFVTLLWNCLLATATSAALGQQLDDLPLERWKDLRENERYQLQIAEKYYREQNWKVAAAEYEKFLTLYEKSSGAPYAQLKWSLSQVQLKKQNTAIKEGFQSVLDYWPESAEAVAAAYYMAQTYKAIGQTPKAKAAYKDLLAKHPDHVAAVYATADLAELATQDKDPNVRLDLLRKLTFQIKRTPATQGVCVQASQALAALAFERGLAEEATKAIATSYPPDQTPGQIVQYARSPLSTQMASAEKKSQAERTADGAIGWLRAALPADTKDPAGQTIVRQIYYAIADLYAITARDSRVLETYDQLTKSVGGSDEALGRLAAFYKSRMKFEEARGVYRRYMNASEGLGQVAYSYREQSQWDQAAQTYQQLAGQDPTQAPQWKGELAMTYRSARKFREAQLVYEELIATDATKQGQWRWELASTLRDAGQFKEAIAQFRQCDNFPENFKQMAACHRQTKEFNDAILLYRQIVSNDKNSAPWALLQVGYTQEEAGQKEPAIQTFQQVCKRYPKDGHASTAHAHLQTKYKISITLGGANEGE